ncbi:plakophilin-2 isoform 2-T2 [Odontesthes bonariensis]|uniref:plakophilin-2 isoform X2 n=1 Tax=Odontesthes bonariensis TaxID=219752 RepID=UPI003F58F4DE
MTPVWLFRPRDPQRQTSSAAGASVFRGGVHLKTYTMRSLDDGISSDTKVIGSNFSSRSFSGSLMQRPSRRDQVSPPPIPELSHTRFDHSTYRHMMRTAPRPGHSHAVGTLQDYSHGPVFSEWTSSSTPVKFNRSRSIRPMPGPQSVFAAATLHQNSGDGFTLRYRQNSVYPGKHTVQGHNNMMFKSTQPDGALSWPSLVRGGGYRSQRSPLKRPQLSYSHTVNNAEANVGKQAEAELAMQQTQIVKKEPSGSKMTLQRAVNLLKHDDEEKLIIAAKYIQDQCLHNAEDKKMMYNLHGIETLLRLLENENEEVQRAAAGALRNVVYQNDDNKVEVKDKGGLALISSALADSRDMETRRQLTGLLWNLSSHNVLKEFFCETLRVLTKYVLVPSSGLSEGENPKDELLADADSFYNTTGCLRNLSSAGPNVRRAMRECENLIDSLVYYIRGTIANYETDDKSTENCVGILRNLAFEVEPEYLQQHSQRLSEPQQNLASEPSTLGCFPYHSAKIKKDPNHEPHLLEEKPNPRGIEWLWSPISIRMFLSVMARSKRHLTQEAAIEALQNITAGNGEMSRAVALTIVQRENGLMHLKKVLEGDNGQVKTPAICLIRNLSRYQELHPAIGNHVLSSVVQMLFNDNSGSNLHNEVTALLFILINLSVTDVNPIKAIISHKALPKIVNISNADKGGGLNRASQAASVLLYTMWKHSDLHQAFKRCSFKKSDFINERTTKAVNEFQKQRNRLTV